MIRITTRSKTIMSMPPNSLALAGAVGISRAKNQRRWCLQHENVFREELCTVASDYQGKRKNTVEKQCPLAEERNVRLGAVPSDIIRRRTRTHHAHEGRVSQSTEKKTDEHND